MPAHIYLPPRQHQHQHQHQPLPKAGDWCHLLENMWRPLLPSTAPQQCLACGLGRAESIAKPPALPGSHACSSAAHQKPCGTCVARVASSLAGRDRQGATSWRPSAPTSLPTANSGANGEPRSEGGGCRAKWADSSIRRCNAHTTSNRLLHEDMDLWDWAWLRSGAAEGGWQYRQGSQRVSRCCFTGQRGKNQGEAQVQQKAG